MLCIGYVIARNKCVIRVAGLFCGCVTEGGVTEPDSGEEEGSTPLS